MPPLKNMSKTLHPSSSVPLRLSVVSLAGCLACLTGTAAMAQTAAPAVASASDALPAGTPATSGTPPAQWRVRGFSVIGDNPLGSTETLLVMAPFLRSELSLDTLQQATSALEARLQAKGHALHRVVLPPQEVTETLTLQVVKFAIGKVNVEGAGEFGEANIRRSLPELQEGGTPHFHALAVQTALANDNPAKQVQVALKASDDNPDLIDATVRVQAAPPLQWSASLSNTGTASTGRDRLSLVGSHANLFERDHQLSVAYTTSLARPSDVRQVGLTYRVPFYTVGGMLDASFTDSNVVGQFGTFTSTGAGRTAGLSYTHHYGTEDGLTRFAMMGLEDKVFNPVQLNGIPLAGQQQRRSRPLTLSYRAKQQTDTAYWDAGVSLSTNLSGGGGNHLQAYQSERPAVTTTRWQALRFQGGRVDSLPGGWLMGWRGQGQWASTALIAGEQFGLGGTGNLRGAGERVLSADSGLSTSLEFTAPEWPSGIRPLAFVDAGWLRGRQSNSDSAASVGLGLRYARGSLALALDYGRIVKGSRVSLAQNPSTNAPQRGDHKLHLNLSARF